MAVNGLPRFNIQRYLISGLLTVIPIWATWIVLEFVFRGLSRIGSPVVRAVAGRIQKDSPRLARLLLHPWFQDFLGVVLVLVVLYILGWSVHHVLGRQLVKLFDWHMEQLPVVRPIYKLVKKLVGSLQATPDGAQRVVLIEFPNPNMKTVGLVTRTLTDSVTGKELAAVYVPTTPNPTSGYLEIVPIERVVATDWTIDEAMSFIISGGAVAPDTFHYGDGL